MKNCKVKAVILIPLVVLLFTVCSSIPKPSSPDSTLLVIPVTKDQVQTDLGGLEFWLYLEDGSKHRVDFSGSENLAFITGLEAGKLETRFLRANLDPRYSSSSGKRNWDYPLRVSSEVIPGRYTILPVIFVYREVKEREANISFSIDFVKITPQDRSRILYKLEEMGIDDYWDAAE